MLGGDQALGHGHSTKSCHGVGGGGGREGGELYPGPEILNYNPSPPSQFGYVLGHWSNISWIFDFFIFLGHVPFLESVFLCVFTHFPSPPMGIIVPLWDRTGYQ